MIKKRGKATYQVIIERGRDESGHRKRQFLTVRGTKKDAEKAERDALVAIERGTAVDASKLTLADALETWMREHVRVSLRVSTARRYQSMVTRISGEPLGRMKLQAVRPLAVQAFYTHLLDEEHLNPRTVRHYGVLLHGAFRWAQRLQLVAVNPTDGATAPRVQPHEVKALNPEEISRLVESMAAGDLRNLTLVTVATGLRISEALALRWSDYQDEQLRVERAVSWHPGEGFVFQRPKTRAGNRAIRLGSSTIEVLRTHRAAQLERRLSLGRVWQDRDLIFPGEFGEIWSPNRVTKQFTAAAKAAGFLGFTFHGLRHTSATLMLRGGIDVKLAASRLGHANTAVTSMVYQHVQPDLEQRVAEVMDRLLAATN